MEGTGAPSRGVRRSERLDEHSPPFAPKLRISSGIALLPPLDLYGML